MSNKGQGLIEYALILVLIAVVVVVIMGLISYNPTPCNRERPNAGQVVDCIGTRTAEAHNK